MVQINSNSESFNIFYSKQLLFVFEDTVNIDNSSISKQFYIYICLSVLLTQYGLFDETFIDNSEY